MLHIKPDLIAQGIQLYISNLDCTRVLSGTYSVHADDEGLDGDGRLHLSPKWN